MFFMFLVIVCVDVSIFAGRTHQVDSKKTTTAHELQQPLAQPRKPSMQELAL